MNAATTLANILQNLNLTLADFEFTCTCRHAKASHRTWLTPAGQTGACGFGSAPYEEWQWRCTCREFSSLVAA